MFLPTIQGVTNFHDADEWGGTTNRILDFLCGIVV